jgi:hypothetical protein
MSKLLETSLEPTQFIDVAALGDDVFTSNLIRDPGDPSAAILPGLAGDFEFVGIDAMIESLYRVHTHEYSI